MGRAYVGLPETDRVRAPAMSRLGLGLHDAGHHEDALVVQEAELSTIRRLGGSEGDVLTAQNNLANSYHDLGRNDEVLRLR